MSVNLILISERFNLLVKYNPDITYSENLEYLHEQETGFTRRLDKIYSEPKTASEHNKEMGKITRGLIDWFKTFDAHDWLTLIEISGTLLAFVSGPFAPIFIGVASVAGLADATLYYTEGDPYMGTMMLALSLLGMSELKTALRGSVVLMKRGKDGCKQLIKKAKSGERLTKQELEDLKSLGKDFITNASEVKRVLKIQTTKNLIENIGKKSTKYLMNLIMIFKKMNILKLPELTLKLGGVVYTADKLYLYVFRDSIFADKSALDKRTTNELRKMINHLLGFDKEVREWSERTTQLGFERAQNSGIDMLGVNPKETLDDYYKPAIDTVKVELMKKREEEKKSVQAPSINDILKNKVVMRKGQEGESVKKVQEMLNELGYDYLLNDFGSSENAIDGQFGENTKEAVEYFQEDEGISPVDGIVGEKTLKKILNKYKEIKK